jgi:hypothetical protein
MTAGMLPLLPTSQNDPHGLGRAEAFWNSFSCDRSIAALQSVPAFLSSNPRRVPVPPVRSRGSMPELEAINGS